MLHGLEELADRLAERLSEMTRGDQVATALPNLGAVVEGERLASDFQGPGNPELVVRGELPELVALYQQGRLMLDELISARYPLEGINEAIADVRAGAALRNVIVF